MVLVTHQIQHLKDVKKIVVLEHGKIRMQGTYSELREKGLDFDKILEGYNKKEEDKEDEIILDDDEEEESVNQTELSKLTKINDAESQDQVRDDPDHNETQMQLNDIHSENEVNKNSDIIEKETIEEGEVPISLWFKFYNYG